MKKNMTPEEKWHYIIDKLKGCGKYEMALDAQHHYIEYLERQNELYFDGWMRKWDEVDNK